MNGYIHYLRKTENPEEIRIIAFNDYRKDTLEHFYSDFPIIKFYWIQANDSWTYDFLVRQINGKPSGTIITFEGFPYICKIFGSHSIDGFLTWEKENRSWADSFYLQHKLEANIRFTEFLLPTNMGHAKKKYDIICKELKTDNFILIHDDPTRGRFMNENLIKKILREDNMENIPVLYLGHNRYSYPLFDGLINNSLSHLLESPSILDFVFLLQNAKACHFMDSSFACLSDALNVKGKVYIHTYITNMSLNKEKLPHRQCPWIYINVDGTQF